MSTISQRYRTRITLRPELGRPVLAIAPRLGVMAHYDASVTDRGAIEWLLSLKCKLGYNFLIWDDGQVFEIIPRTMRAPHAGVCRTSDPRRLPYPDGHANSAFYGVAFAAGGRAGDRITDAQIRAFADVARELFAAERWPLAETWRVTSHHVEACYPRLTEDGRPHPRAGQRGRKVDIIGYDAAHPVATLEALRTALHGV
jgi:N-acetyl-anhydromuramyl-L-alanine amidase AmpD